MRARRSTPPRSRCACAGRRASPSSRRRGPGISRRGCSVAHCDARSRRSDRVPRMPARPPRGARANGNPRGRAARHRANVAPVRILSAMLRGLLGLAVVAALGACARPPSAPVQAVRPLTPDELAYLAPAERQAHVLARACERDDASACERLGGAYWVGNGVPQHKFHALALWTYACERGIGTACEEAAKQYDHGELVPVDGTR